MKTRYRTVSNGYWDYLEYEVETKGFFGTKHSWHKVPRAYYDQHEGRSNLFGLNESDLYISGLNTNLKNFVEKYSDIADYWPHYKVEQAKAEERAREKNSKYARENGKITYL